MTMWETSNTLWPKSNSRNLLKRKVYRNVFYKKVFTSTPILTSHRVRYTTGNKTLCSSYNIVVCSPNLEQTDPSVFVRILIFNFQKPHTVEITCSGQHLLNEPIWMLGVFFTISIISKATTAPVTLEEKIRLWEVLNTEEQNRHKEKSKA